MAAIEISGVSKTYAANVQAIKGIDLSIRDGEFVVLVGPSGCGKSTLLRMIAGLESVSGGEIRIGDKLVNTLEPSQRDIAMVFQNYALYPHMTVRGNLEYGLKNRRTPRPEIDRRVGEAARILEIESFLDRKPQQLSGGQRQRVAMGRAIVRQPKAFLFDEPLSNLDARLRGQMRVEIRRLQKTLGTTSVYVTHDQLEAMTLADTLVVMNGGQIEQVGRPLDVYTTPQSLFVAGFMGSPGMNLIALDELRATGISLLGAIPARTGTLGIRPDDIVMDPSASVEGIALTGVLDAVELIGSESLVYTHVAGISGEIVLRVPDIHAGQAGDTLDFVLPARALHSFDAETGRRLP